jgi:hypothetical protein
MKRRYLPALVLFASACLCRFRGGAGARRMGGNVETQPANPRNPANLAPKSQTINQEAVQVGE